MKRLEKYQAICKAMHFNSKRPKLTSRLQKRIKKAEVEIRRGEYIVCKTDEDIDSFLSSLDK
jgi:hypothetical protein